MIELTLEPIDANAILQHVRRTDCGAVLLFLGTVRELTGDVRTVCLDYDAYSPMASKKMQEIEQAVRNRWPIGEFAMVHRLGRLQVGEVSVAIAISSPHRSEAFEAARYAIETLKELVPIWKKENAPDGSGDWVHHGTRPGISSNPGIEP